MPAEAGAIPRSRRRALRRAVLWGILCGAFLGWTGPARAEEARSEVTRSGELSPAEERGRRIFVDGTASGGEPLIALMGDEGFEVPATAVPCASCHGHDGRGRPEGGISPSDVTWPALTRADGVRANGRRRGPYDERSLVRAIAQGFDPEGAELSSLMPRYRLSHAQAEDLLAFLRRLGGTLDPGLEETVVRLGLVLPASAEGDRIEGLLQAHAEAVNRTGGVYHRSLELVSLRSDGPLRPAALEEFLERSRPFALIAPVISGAEREVADLLSRERVPAVGAVAGDPDLGFPLNRYLFYLHPGIPGQAAGLLAWSAGAGGTAGGLGLAIPATEAGRRWKTTLESAARRLGWESVWSRELPSGGAGTAGLAAAAQRAGIETLVFLGGAAQADAFYRDAAALRYWPSVLVPGGLIGAGSLGVGTGFGGRLVHGFPLVPEDASPAGREEIHGILAAAGSDRAGEALSPPELVAAASFKCAVEGMLRAGRALSRERLVDELESFYRFQTGLTRPVVFGPNRRIGAKGIHPLEVDLDRREFVRLGEWQEIDALK